MKNLSLLLLISLLSSACFAQTFTQTGIASFYADKFEGRPTASGEKYKHSKMTAAHKTLPFGTILKVKNLSNGKIIEVRVNDRGPFVEGRIIDLSKMAAKKLDFINQGIVKVEITSINSPDPSRATYSSLDQPQGEILPEAKDYYSLDVEKQVAKGFGVQIGSFTELVNLVELSAKIGRAQNEKIFVQVSVIQNVKYYKLIIGNLKTREKATKLMEKLSTDYPDSFVIKF
jgi:rare lipoprotein A